MFAMYLLVFFSSFYIQLYVIAVNKVAMYIQLSIIKYINAIILPCTYLLDNLSIVQELNIMSNSVTVRLVYRYINL